MSPLWAGYPGFGYYVFHMPVTSLENRIRGNKIWGLPKTVETIDIHEDGGDCVTDLTDETGGRTFSLRVPMDGKPTSFDTKAWVYSRLGNQLVRGQTAFKAEFKVRKYMSRLWNTTARPDREYLTLGDTAMGRTLKGLDIDTHPFQFRFAKHMNAAFDLPQQNYRAPFGFQSRP